MRWPEASLLCLLPLLRMVAPQREHKVHNIVLYPHKHSWCKTTPIKQVVAHPGCDSVEVENNVCVGGCFSYSIPRTIPSAPGEVAPYCDSCQPSTHTWKPVVLNCTSGEYEGELLSKMVQVIENCTCAKCSDQFTTLSDEDQLSALEEQASPQLMDSSDSSPLRYGNYSVLNNSSQGNNSLINHRTLVLLGELGEGEGDELETGEDQLALREILHQVEGEDHKVDGAILKDFVRRVEENGHININVKRLQKVLEKLENSEHKTQHRHQHQHMMMGPHHSLVLPRESEQPAEEFLKPTLDVPSHMMRPAHEGAECRKRATPLPWLPVLSNIAPSEVRRNVALLREFIKILSSPNLPSLQDLPATMGRLRSRNLPLRSASARSMGGTNF